MTTSPTSPYQDGTDYTILGDVSSDAEAARDAAQASAAAAALSATNASSSQSAAATSASGAANSATNAAASATSASGSASAASTSATNASTSATNAGNSATAAAGSASSASTSATNAGNSATAAAGSATSASGSATTATTQATNASNSATAAAGSATSAGTSATNAGNSATAASGSASTASTQAGNASTSATNASNSATAAATSATNANTYAGNASTSATNAANSATAAATSASNASTSATNAGTSETNAASYAAKATGTSTTSLAIGTGTKVFTTQSGKDFNVGTSLWAIDSVDTTRYMFGTITAYSGTSLTVNVLASNNSGTYASWNLYGRAGPQGAAAAGTGDFVGPAGATNGNFVKFGDGTGKLGADSGKAVPTGAVVGTTDTQTLSGKTIASPALTFGTGSNQNINADSSNTGFTNQVQVINSGTGSNASTVAASLVALGGVANGYGAFQINGGSTPTVGLSSGSGATGGFAISSNAGAVSLSGAGGIKLGTSSGIPKLTSGTLGTAADGTDYVSPSTLASTAHAFTAKTTPVAADEVMVMDSAASFAGKRSTFSNIIASFKSTAAALWAGTSDILFLTAKNAADSEAFVTLTSSTAIATDCSTGTNFFVTLGHNTTFGAPTNPIDGRTYSWLIQQDATGSRTGAWNSAFEFSATPTLSTTAGKRDLVTAQYHAASSKFIAGFRKSA